MRLALRRQARKVAAFAVGFGLLVGPGVVFLRAHQAADPALAPGDYNPPPHAERDRAFRIVAFGSSSTRGFGASSPALTYPAQLAALFAERTAEVEVVNRGVNGENIDAMMRRLQSDVLSRHPGLILWQVGSNDILAAMPLDHFKQQIRDGVARMRAEGAVVILLGPQWSPRIAAADPDGTFVQAVNDVGRTEGLEVIDRTRLMRSWVADHVATQAQLIGPDNLHSSDLGYKLLARNVFDRVAPRVLAAKPGRVAGQDQAGPGLGKF